MAQALGVPLKDLQWRPTIDAATPLVSSQVQPTSEGRIISEILLPSLYGEIKCGEVAMVLQRLQQARKLTNTALAEPLRAEEAYVARISGARGTSNRLNDLMAAGGNFGDRAFLESLFVQFAAGKSLGDTPMERLEALPEQLRLSANALVGLSLLGQTRRQDAEDAFRRARPETIGETADDYYRAVPLGILCFAMGEGDLGEEYFGLAKAGPDERVPEGYPFVHALSALDRRFVVCCMGKEIFEETHPKYYSESKVDNKKINSLRGHVLVLLQLSRIFRMDEIALKQFANRSVKWTHPLAPEAIAGRLQDFTNELIEGLKDPPIVS